MDSNSPSSTNKKGFYTINPSSPSPTKESMIKPTHLEKRFNSNNKNTATKLNKQAVEIKREAILQERKNRLNQNFLKVARIAKEMKDRREDKINLLSKSMESAESNRKQHIEKRRAASKQTVERAKNIVIANQYKSLQEQERRRAELESRFEKTEQRRLAHLNNRYKKEKKQQKKALSSSSSPKSVVSPKTTTPHPLSSPATPPPPATMSSVTIEQHQQQTAEPVKKKPSSWSIILKAFKELGLPLPSKSDTWLEFNSLGKLLHQPKVIVVTTKVLNTALKLNDQESRHRARVLLTSYMTLICPKEVLQDVEGVEEKRLHASAKQMLQLFETWLKAHGRPGATAARLAFCHAWNEYNVLFEAWKSRDFEQLIKNMTAYYVELSTLRQTMIAQHDDNSVGDQLQQQLDQIKTKLEKLGGSTALEGLQRALELSAASTSTGRRKQQQNNTPRGSPEFNNDQQEREPTVNGEQLGQVLNGYAPESGLTNEQLAHELIMDPEFKLSRREQATNGLEKRVRMMAEKAFFDKVAQDMEKGTPELSLPSLVADVKARLLSLVRPGTSMYTSIDEAIDLPLMEQQMRQNSFDINGMMHYVLDIMSNMCAPVRDVEIQEIRGLNIMEQIQEVLTSLENMSLDLANFRLRSLRPHLMSMAVEYERGKFAEMLMNGQIQLVRTQSWLGHATTKLCQAAAQRNPEGIQPEKNNKPTHDSIFEEAFVSLLTQQQVIDSLDVLPETLRMDAKRMAEYQNEVQAITIVAALLMLARNFGSATSQQLADLSSKLFTMLEDPTTTIDNLATEIERAVNVRPERREMIRNMVDKTVSHTDTVYSLLSRRVSSIIKSTIQNNKFANDAVLSSNGLQHVRSSLQSISHKILRMIHHHRKVYASYYDEIITKALDQELSATS